MSIKSKTHKGDGFNEIRFEDEADKEEVWMHAQKDRNEKVNNNQSQRINTNKVESVGHNKASEIGNNFFQVVDGNMELRVGPANSGTISPTGASQLKQGLGSVAPRMGMPGESEYGQGNLSVSVEKNKIQSVGASYQETVSENKSTNVGSDYDLHARRSIRIEADEEIVIRCGMTQISMTSDGTVRVSGKKVFNIATDLVEIIADLVKVN